MFKHAAASSKEEFLINPEDYPDGLFIVRQGKLEYLNHAATEIFGYPRDKMMSMDFPDYAVSDDLCIMQGVRVSRMSRSRTPEKFEYFIRRPDGSVRRIALRFSFGSGCRVYVSARDISEHADLESSLEEISLKFRDLVELLPQTVYETDLSLKISYVNESAFSMFGYTRDDYQRGLTVRDIIPFEEWNKASGGISHVLAGGAVRGREYLARRKDGSLFPIEIFSAPLMRSGAVAGMRGIIIDRSERKVREREIEYLRIAMRYLIDNSEKGIVIIDSANNLILAGSDRARELFFVEHGMVSPAYLKDYLPRFRFLRVDGTSYDETDNPVTRAVSGENIDTEIVGICHPDRDVVIWSNLSSVTISAPGGWYGITILQFRDVERM
jgi:PAS domain S-box-containing protein